MLRFHEDCVWRACDFPVDYVSYKHPSDYKFTEQPIKPDLTMVKSGSIQRFFLRVSVQCGDNKYVTMSFVADSGVVKGFLFSQEALGLLSGRLDTKKKTILLNGEPMSYDKTRKKYEPVNFIGVQFIQKYGLEASGLDYI